MVSRLTAGRNLSLNFVTLGSSGLLVDGFVLLALGAVNERCNAGVEDRIPSQSDNSFQLETCHHIPMRCLDGRVCREVLPGGGSSPRLVEAFADWGGGFRSSEEGRWCCGKRSGLAFRSRLSRLQESSSLSPSRRLEKSNWEERRRSASGLLLDMCRTSSDGRPNEEISNQPITVELSFTQPAQKVFCTSGRVSQLVGEEGGNI